MKSMACFRAESFGITSGLAASMALWIAFFLLPGPANADISDIPTMVAEKHYREGRYAVAKKGFRDAITLNSENDSAWDGYERCVLKINELENSPNRVIKDPKFEIVFDGVQFRDVEKFKKRYISIKGKVKNCADVPFKDVKIVLTLLDEKGIEVERLTAHLDEIEARQQLPFKFQNVVKHFADYRVHAEK